MNGDIPLWLDVLVMVGAGAFAGGAAAAVTGRDIKSRAAGSAVAFGMMTLAWRAALEAENKVREREGLPPKPPRS
jgi:NADH:ubiquinone oxidoreductase subunit 5 (subunit L)/multisubunit Na+/H+ antiporter MnhA subunit